MILHYLKKFNHTWECESLQRQRRSLIGGSEDGKKRRKLFANRWRGRYAEHGPWLYFFFFFFFFFFCVSVEGRKSEGPFLLQFYDIRGDIPLRRFWYSSKCPSHITLIITISLCLFVVLSWNDCTEDATTYTFECVGWSNCRNLKNHGLNHLYTKTYELRNMSL